MAHVSSQLGNHVSVSHVFTFPQLRAALGEELMATSQGEVQYFEPYRNRSSDEDDYDVIVWN